MTSPAFLNDKLSRKTFFFGLKLGSSSAYASAQPSSSSSSPSTSPPAATSPGEVPACHGSSREAHHSSVFKEIQEIRVQDPEPSLALALVPQEKEESPQRIHIEIGKENWILYPEKAGAGTGTGSDGNGSSRPEANELALGVVVGQPEISHLGWGHWYTMRELEKATGGFSPDNG